METLVNKELKMSDIISYVKGMIDKISTNAYYDDSALSASDFAKKKNKNTRLFEKLKDCVYGDYQAKTYVKDYICDLLKEYESLNQSNINYLITFDNPQYLSAQDKFDIVLHIYKKKHERAALITLIEDFKLDQLKYDNENICYKITAEEIDNVYSQVVYELDYEDKLDILVQRVYSLVKGFNCVDDIRDMQIDGVSGGVNGYPENFILDHSKEYETYLSILKYHRLPRSYDSVWIYYKGKQIQLEFLSFGSYEELERVCLQIYKFGKPGTFSEDRGYIVNRMKDGSRIVVLRPPFCDSWAFLVRKFDLPFSTLEYLITGENSDITVQFLKYLMKGERCTAITGSQGTGKTTLLLALIGHIYNIHPLRILELSFELHARKVYPNKNILTVCETSDIDGQEALNMFKKTDGAVSVLGEIASAEVATYALDVARVASLFAVFTHHAKTFDDLVKWFRNALLKMKVFSDAEVAEEEVVSILEFDVHLDKTKEGMRYISRITECHPLEDKDLSESFLYAQNSENAQLEFLKTKLEFYKKMTRRQKYIARDIIVYDVERKKYSVKNELSRDRVQSMYRCMIEKDRLEFIEFLHRTGLYTGEL